MTLSRRRFLRNLGLGLAAPTSAGAYATQVEPFWPEIHTVPMPVRDLPAAFEGMRIAHLTDLHVSNVVPLAYVRGVIEHVNRLRPDMVFVTGDLVTQGEGWIDQACDAVAALRAPTYVSLGNHDYGRINYHKRNIEVSDELEKRLTAGGCIVLRNQAKRIRRDDAGIWVMGLEDLWSGRFAPAETFAQVNTREPVLALSHNPDTARALDNYGVDWVISGHTHGGQVRIPGFGAILLPVQDRSLQQGQVNLGRGQLYISRGVGFLKRVRFCCRPEVPIFTLRRA